jgi:segregation and condensation protein A
MEIEPNTGPPEQSPADGSADAYRIHVEGFDGPLDLLLHLVRINEVDLTDIPILTITEQYNDYLNLMREMNLEIAGEYLVMAATLMHIKSQSLLPPDPTAEGEEETEDPRTELAQQLLEYQKYKQAAETLQAMDNRRTLIWVREDGVPEEFAGEELLTVDLMDLIGSFKKMLGRLDEESRLRMKKDSASVADKITWLTELLEQQTTISLNAVLETLDVRQERIAAFLAVLEMMRLHLIVVFQRKLIGEIRIARAEDLEPGPPAEGGV